MTFEVLVGSSRTLLASLPEKSFNTCVTSPPYWGLRDYGTGRWEGGDEACDHKNTNLRADHTRDEVLETRGTQPYAAASSTPMRDVCRRCGARRVDEQIGLEATPAEYVAKLVEVFRGVRRVLRDDGTLWLNLGDSYSQSGRGPEGENCTLSGSRRNQEACRSARANTSHLVDGLKRKDLVGIPWRVAFALQDDGWFLRQDCIWHKPNPMPESVVDRCVKAHEYVFLLSKSQRYHFDHIAIRERATGRDPGNVTHKAADEYQRGDEHDRTKSGLTAVRAVEWRNKRSVWTIKPSPFKGAHFATMPVELARVCVRAGCPTGGRVLDVFGGAGTTGVAAIELDAHATLLELNPEYAEMARVRCAGAVAEREKQRRQQTLPFEGAAQ